MPVLSPAAGLTDRRPSSSASLLNRFLVGDLRPADIGADLELTDQAVDDDLEVQFAHPGDDRLAGFLVHVRPGTSDPPAASRGPAQLCPGRPSSSARWRPRSPAPGSPSPRARSGVRSQSVSPVTAFRRPTTARCRLQGPRRSPRACWRASSRAARFARISEHRVDDRASGRQVAGVNSDERQAADEGVGLILKTSAANGSSSSARRRVLPLTPSGRNPSIGGTSSGDGRKSTTASSSGCTPLFLNAEPQRTGTIDPPMVPALSPRRICSSSSVPLARYRSRNSSEVSAAASIEALAVLFDLGAVFFRNAFLVGCPPERFVVIVVGLETNQIDHPGKSVFNNREGVGPGPRWPSTCCGSDRRLPRSWRRRDPSC